jgi:NAD(P)H-hydrate epimerase
LVRTLVAQAELPVVLDADGLNAFEKHGDELDGRKKTLVLTPHPGEMARLAGISTEKVQRDRLGVARRFAQDHHCMVVLKGHRTVIALPGGDAWINPTGNPGMATGGTGDILTGLIAGLVPQGGKTSPALPVHAGTYLHGLAGDLAAERLGQHSLVATSLLEFLPDAFQLTRALALSPFAWIQLGPNPSRLLSR